ncbi:MAG: NAD(P)H-hydrate dehydratase [Chthoniobacterales bacterium]
MSNLILTSKEVQELEKRAFAEGVGQEDLMDLAGLGIGRKIAQLEPVPGTCVVYLGKGNNAGDAIVAASVLERSGWSISARLVSSPEDLDLLPKKKWNALAAHFRRTTSVWTGWSDIRPIILLDGLLGLGARPGLSDRYRQLTAELNGIRSDWNARTYAVDIPTGLSDSAVDPHSVIADVTLTVGFPKSCLFLDEATNVVGNISVIDLPALSERAPAGQGRSQLTVPGALYDLVKRRPFDSHKGDFGRVGIIAGSRGLIGAGALASKAALKAGAGLITLYATEDVYSIVATKAETEVMVKPVAHFREALSDRLDAIAIGPGLGRGRAEEVIQIVREFANPMVVDADALNIISEHPETLSRLAGPRLLTPHPGEMSRLFSTNNLPRAEISERFTNEYPVTLLLKGARTLVAQRGYSVSYNSTGTPGMATGGSGDLLTGVCGALLGRGIAPYDAARLGAWLCGRAAELTLRDESEESMIPSDTLRYLGKAFEEIRQAGSQNLESRSWNSEARSRSRH